MSDKLKETARVLRGIGDALRTTNLIRGRQIHQIADDIERIAAPPASDAPNVVKRMQEALQWYAGEIDYTGESTEGNAWRSNKDVPTIPNVIFDQGKLAQAVLAEHRADTQSTSAPICPECGHSDTHGKYGCEYERGDAWVTGNQPEQPTVLMAQGPCGCKGPANPARELRKLAVKLIHECGLSDPDNPDQPFDEMDVQRTITVLESYASSREQAALKSEPWAYAIETPGGDMYDGEYAVFGDRNSADDQAENLNDDLPESDEQYKVVELFRSLKENKSE